MEPQPLPTPEQGSNLPPAERGDLPQPGEISQPTKEKLAPQGESASQSAPILPPASLPKPLTGDDQLQPEPKERQHQTGDVGPAVADDVDVIEKEWVDKAKSIVNEHKHDPYNQEKETSKLQADYLKKRYGKDVKLPS